MGLVIACAIALVTIFRWFSLASPITQQKSHGNASITPRLALRDGTTTGISVTKMAAIGDSYSAGIGAGDRLGNIALQGQGTDYTCSRYDHAHPYLIHHDDRIGDPAARTFQFKSCSGALTADVLGEQIPAIDAGQEVILLSIGGNDAELTKILNQCIYQWAVLNPTQVHVAKAAALLKSEFRWAVDMDWDSLGLGCEGQISRTWNIINSPEFSNRLAAVVAAAKAKLAPGGTIYYTGYAKFFADYSSRDCDNVSWSIWLYKLWNIFQPVQTLTSAHRGSLNRLVNLMNEKISTVVAAAGPNVIFIDYDQQVGDAHGRFCEADVDETPRVSNAREGLMFYELDWSDPLGKYPWRRDTDGIDDKTFEGNLDQFAQITLLMDPDAELAFGKSSASSAALSEENFVAAHGHVELFEVPNLLPDGYGRVFHPQILLHQLISNLVVESIIQTTNDDEEPEVELIVPPACRTGSNGCCSVQSKRDQQQVNAMVSHLVSRAPVGIQPLSNPKSGDLESYVEWFEDILDPEEGKMETTDIPIEPSESQVATWRVVYRKGVPIPIGVTAAWFPFGDQPRNFKMEGLIGCTGIIAASSKGLYGAHLWEGSGDPNSYSSFGKTYISKRGKRIEINRTPLEFKFVAVDIWEQDTPPGERQNRNTWTSIGDLVKYHGDPFEEGSDVDTLFLTRCEGVDKREPLYADQVQALRDKFKVLLPKSGDKLRTYWNDDPNVPEPVRGSIIIQYSPYDHDGGANGCTPQARVRVFYEDQQEAAIDKSWDSPYIASTSKRSCTPSGSYKGDKPGQQIALATYIDPGANTETWNRIIAMPNNKVSVVVANVANGPDSSANAGWTDVIPRTLGSGKTVLGYVRTGYLGVSVQQFTTRLGSSKTSDWVAQIQEDVDQWYHLYPGINGIFFDEGWNDCGPDNVSAELYKYITQHTKKKYPGAFTVLNPGAPMPQCFEHSADTLLTAEVSYATYTSSGYVPCDWTPSDPRKLWHIVYDVPQSAIASVVNLATERGVGLLHITDDVEPNPYDTVPSQKYMQDFMDIVPGGTPPNDGVFGLAAVGAGVGYSPSTLNLLYADYSSASFTWAASPNVLGYNIYQNTIPVLSLPPSMTEVTIGGLSPGEYYTFGISAIGRDGKDLGVVFSTAVSTKSLGRNGHTVSTLTVSYKGPQTIFAANIVVPYAFIRLFFYDGKCNLGAYSCPGCELRFGWPINFSQYDTACNQYMVEGGTLFKYNGKIDSDGNMPWSWTWVAEVPLVQKKYEWTWNVPMSSTELAGLRYLVQVQGYGPKFNVYYTCPTTDSKMNVTVGTAMAEGSYCID